MTDKNNNNNNLKTQFTESYRGWLEREHTGSKVQGSPFFSVDELIERRYTHGSDERSLVGLTMNVVLTDILIGRTYYLDSALRLCESVIEHMMLNALIIVVSSSHGAPTLVLNDKHIPLNWPNGPEILIQPQAKLGDYRVDFLVTNRFVNSSENILSSTSMVVECDGHNYHERTKEQAKRDRQRDRMMQSLGYLVYRYTGSEIWSDVFKCADEIYSTLCADLSSKIQALAKK